MPEVKMGSEMKHFMYTKEGKEKAKKAKLAVIKKVLNKNKNKNV